MAFEELGDNMTKKAGPLPVWAWGVLIGGAFVLWYWFRQGSSVSTETAEDGSTGTVATPSGDFSVVPVLPEGGNDVQDEHTNAEWLAQASNAVANSGVSYVAAQTALMKFLNGGTLSVQEQAIVDKARQLVGPPPEGTMGIPEVTPDPDADKSVNWATKTTISVSSKTKFGRSLVAKYKVSWVDSYGHTAPPIGPVETTIDGGLKRTYPLVNGQAVRVMIIGKNVDAFKDKVAVLGAAYRPKEGWKTQGSSATPVTVRIS